MSAIASTRARISDVLADVIKEVGTSDLHYGDFSSMHEAYGVLAEEVDEFFDAVKMKQSPERCEAVYREAIQVAAVALRIAEQARRVTR